MRKVIMATFGSLRNSNPGGSCLPTLALINILERKMMKNKDKISVFVFVKNDLHFKEEMEWAITKARLIPNEEKNLQKIHVVRVRPNHEEEKYLVDIADLDLNSEVYYPIKTDMIAAHWQIHKTYFPFEKIKDTVEWINRSLVEEKETRRKIASNIQFLMDNKLPMKTFQRTISILEKFITKEKKKALKKERNNTKERA